MPSFPRILVPCERLVMNGGLLRFDRMGHVVRSLGGELVFLQLGSGSERTWSSPCPVITLKEAQQARWDATMVPGAGFFPEVIRQFTLLKEPSFGLRVQHLLNDRNRLQGFLRLNHIFKPDMVIANNRDLRASDLARFHAPRGRFVLEGAVDLNLLHPDPERVPLQEKRPVAVGGLANKNIQPLLQSLQRLPSFVCVDLIGTPGPEALLAAETLPANRVTFRGVIAQSELPDYFRAVDLVVHAETFAGWANIAAEAMASGIPVVGTAAGTQAILEHEQTGLLLDHPDPLAISNAIQRLLETPRLAERLTHQARTNILNYGWQDYTCNLLRRCGLLPSGINPDPGACGTESPD